MSAKITVRNTIATPEQLAKALGQLSEADLARIQRIAKMRATGLATDWQDLLQESLARALGGSRRWPTEVPLIAFLAQTIRSVANEEWERVGRDAINESDLPSSGADPIDLAELAATTVHPESEVQARSVLRQIEKHFEDDPQVLSVLEGMALGLEPAEVQVRAGLSETQYASAQKRLRRKVIQGLF